MSDSGRDADAAEDAPTTQVNAALALHDIFAAWRDGQEASNQTRAPFHARGFHSSPDKALATHRQAMRLLGVLEIYVARLEQAGRPQRVARKHLESWTRIILAYPLQWQGSASPEEAVPDASLDALEQFAEIIDASGLLATAEDVRRLGGGVTEALRLLREDDSLSDDLRYYVSVLLQEVRIVLENDYLQDGFDFKQAQARLRVAMEAAAGQSKTGDPWREAIKTYLIPVFTGVGTNLAVSGSGIALRALGVAP
ncbi:hypothetical protein [Curtobacterium poinsettiae]|uniref:hypothetical protein n=1 Tax=Curtobacterium poinsettiae TaxID=159612 RepID=UPI0021C98892|nr:hypothetical protein [Curtobacterium flaccumfaciens]MCU0152381.1 hypothetical protein [Curtobacterium flaccumfaciens pv. poinsettiae]UXN15642.1 hypothetical protein N8D76_02820 [Curtobacterium flaccumfaciens pv. poinsettiae]